MGKRAFSPREVMRRTYKRLEWGEPWCVHFGRPTWTETWHISGASASGKSSFVMQLAKELCRHGTVLYLSYEEGISQSFKERVSRFKMTEEQGNFRVALEESYEEVVERLSRPKSAHFIIVDSFQITEWSYEQAKALTERFNRKSFIFISQEDKGRPLGKPSVRLQYLAGMKVRVVGYKAYCLGRFTEDPGSYFVVWDDGVMRTTNTVETPDKE